MADATKLKGVVTTSSPGRDPRGADREVKPRGAARDGGHVAGAEAGAESLLELGEAWAEGEPARAQRVEHQLLLARAHERASERDPIVH